MYKGWIYLSFFVKIIFGGVMRSILPADTYTVVNKSIINYLSNNDLVNPKIEEFKAVDDISFKVNKGETIAFIGSTGSGKSTLINLVPRFYDVTEGEVLVDGVNVKDYKLESLNNSIYR